MTTISKFEKLEIWQEAQLLAKEIHLISKETELKTNFRFKEQIKSSSGSMMDNIAEGFETDGNIEFGQFLSIAKDSVGKCRSQIYRLYDYEYISEDKFVELKNKYENLSDRIIKNFIAYLNKKDFKGTNFQ
ncbi:four helix bundle protein [Flavobacterium columnare]|uniref:Four helix bundle protein n=1 Tax=Flavobacterium columnare TaxID=996 RepID=A0AAI8GB69_9FLAO|nr:four helix bundle protein [Flavobacterium columnare]AMO20292.1 four helix bundle protein [Flavobacterium columnare]AUX18251.1 four helix bundle protein [Flavobacterium columnare]MEB3801188.1 four helix bundle protein [Flavobacterium columnare]QOG57326.1 four helix bundle protein [Flavobacterium columnare]QOG60050.1 four helix bundle protein [Flavobacterium columnare]